MARVEWSRLSGDEVEAVVAILLCREYPTATRIKPSRGDGGIDVWVPGVRGATVFQVKRYTGNIDATRKGHIEDSWDTLQEYVKVNSISQAAWYLVMPENPTKEQLKWFDEELTANAKYPCIWKGLDYLDGLAAKYPDVIDYYLRDGKERLEGTIKDFLATARLSESLTDPATSVESLLKLHSRLNRFDPHFYYDFSVEALGADGRRPPVREAPGLVGAVQLSDTERCVTYRIIARFNEALKERPVPGSMTLVAESGSDLEKKIEDWVRFGTPLTEVPAKGIRLDLPGGFGGEQGDGVVTVGPPQPQVSGTPITLRVLEEDGTVVSSLDFVTEEVSSGLDQQGLRTVGHDMSAGVVRYEMRVTMGDRTGNVNISVEDPVGRSPADLLPGIRFLSSLRPPRRFQLFLRNGPALTPPWPALGTLMPEEQGKLWLTMCESLATIQEHVINRITFPDMARYHADDPMDDIEMWYQAARLLRGESLDGTWNTVGIHLVPGQEPPTEEGQAIFNNTYSARIGDKTYTLGVVTMHAVDARVDKQHPPVVHDDHIDVRFVPGDDDTMTIRLTSSGPGLEGIAEPLSPPS